MGFHSLAGERLWPRAVFAGAMALLLALGSVPTAPNVVRAQEFSLADEAARALPWPAGLRRQIDFWKAVFAAYSSSEVLIHDRADVGRVYSILSFSPISDALTDRQKAELIGRRKKVVKAEVERIREILLDLHQRKGRLTGLDDDARRIAGLFARSLDSDRFLDAAAPGRMRSQTGLQDKFARAMARSGRYLPLMERIFALEGLPLELTRLPFVESSFDGTVYSRTGAAGLWQFMPGTGRLFLRIDEAVDERLDPYVATAAAARFLRGNFEALGAWPVAVTAYNHGRAGMRRAVEKIGSRDIVEIIRTYEGRAFGFASKNFYAELLAAIEVEREAARHFGDIERESPLQLDGVELQHFVSLKVAARAAGMSEAELAALNPALLRSVRRGDLYIPKGYELRLPEGRAVAFRAAYAKLPSSEKHGRQRVVYVRHRVRRGETLSSIVRRYGASIAQVKRDNGIRDANRIRIGQSLKIKVARPGRHAAPARAKFVTHTVQRGQTLGRIARRYGTSVRAILAHNKIRDPNRVLVGTRLRIPR